MKKNCHKNCAGITYTTLYFSESGKSYDHHVADVCSSEGIVGAKNHSGRFPYFFFTTFMLLNQISKTFLLQIICHLVQ